MFCLNWTCLSCEQEHAGSGICGCPLGTSLATSDHGLWFLGLVWPWRCQVFVSRSVQRLMECDLLSAA